MTNPLLVRFISYDSPTEYIKTQLEDTLSQSWCPRLSMLQQTDVFSPPKNKCNRGHVFINLTDPASVIPFYQAFKRMQWVETVEEMQQFLMLRCREKMHSRPTSIVKLEDMHVIRYDLNKRILEGKRDSM
ncbi:uncharacterized protein LOC114307104 isoform X9 [Camellia sinensis]|uniref:uncharacterized protein LOC114307104 isoform X5 n=1 Tax=Camellia sinensis TaxID=4442 RepID=UPI001035C00E|nr:uncharacterized protein LOC114307104 isoform X5 [Camellia sinensis]XP_028108272.1 uncharacterized protein LOC114307104 isoform X6 [Camellia sinensis]XP_028108273.1 uncharacterized protein LOC114307104 isoform X7 [Camellia sinensis]XP_028108274.1 uncharacterized protein LOC114307104 isoform X7 [Camellia sinensis]XP_028108275.1 uncharacterized protein LOC114307104 isoform X6 [Camellia sinensis]XP_028108276.1 uncharacterized protein LOC114307104 isoform X5 [Camellia sinensis]XP_028108277.1 un